MEGEGEKRGDFVRELELPGAAWGAPRQDLETTGAYLCKSSSVIKLLLKE